MNKKVREAMKHPNVLGAGAKKRKSLDKSDNASTVMSEWKRGTLHSGDGKIVPKSNKAQALAILMSENSKKKNKGK
jgi:hypothetical protein